MHNYSTRQKYAIAGRPWATTHTEHGAVACMWPQECTDICKGSNHWI